MKTKLEKEEFTAIESDSNKLTAILDACVLYKSKLRDLLMQLAVKDLFRAKWTEEINDEWIKNILKNKPNLERWRLERTREKMNSNVRDCLVYDYQNHIPLLKLPDQKDNHVLAAAIHANAKVIVTYNLKDFPSEYLQQYYIAAQHPDDFINHLMDLYPLEVYRSIEEVSKRLKAPPISIKELLEIYEKNLELNKSVVKVRLYSELESV